MEKIFEKQSVLEKKASLELMIAYVRERASFYRASLKMLKKSLSKIEAECESCEDKSCLKK